MSVTKSDNSLIMFVNGVGVAIAYGMLGFERDGSVFCHLNAQKAFVGLYLGDVARLDPDGGLTSGLNVGKGCIRVRKSDDLDALRAAMEEDAPHFADTDMVFPAAELPDGEKGAFDDAAFDTAVKDFYLTNPIARASRVMALCSAEKSASLSAAAD